MRWAGKHEQDTQKLDRETEVLKEIKQQDLATMLELEERCARVKKFVVRGSEEC